MCSPAEGEQSLSRRCSRCVNSRYLWNPDTHISLFYAGMASAQTRIADTVELFYTGSDRTSDGALAANAYKRAVEDLDHSVTRELVYLLPCSLKSILNPKVGYPRTPHTERRSWNLLASSTHISQP